MLKQSRLDSPRGSRGSRDRQDGDLKKVRNEITGSYLLSLVEALNSSHGSTERLVVVKTYQAALCV